MFYLNTIEQLFLFVEQLDKIEVCLPNSRLLTGIPILAVFKNLSWNSNKTSLTLFIFIFSIGLQNSQEIKCLDVYVANKSFRVAKKIILKTIKWINIP